MLSPSSGGRRLLWDSEHRPHRRRRLSATRPRSGVLVWFVVVLLLFFCLYVFSPSRPISSEEETAAQPHPERVEGKRDELESFVMFIGYPRSGHTLIGSLLDAHPAVVIAHEYNVLAKLLAPSSEVMTRERLFNELVNTSIQFSAIHGQVNQGYNYRVPNQWQGRWNRTIRVLGDKRGGATTRAFLENPKEALKAVFELENMVKVPFRWIHVIRNPLDNIATMATRKLDPTRSSAYWREHSPVEMPRNLLEDSIREYFLAAKKNHELHSMLPGLLLDIFYEDFVAAPQAGLQSLCQFLGLKDCDATYLQDCASIVFASPVRSRTFFSWPKDLLQQVERKTSFFPSLAARYSWDS